MSRKINNKKLAIETKSKKRAIYLRIILILVIINTIFTLLQNHTFGSYFSSKTGNVKISVARPICQLTTQNNITISNYKVEPFYFYITNYDGNTLSDVAMKYWIIIESYKGSNTPLNYNLYRIYDNGTEKKVDINIDNDNGIIETAVSSCFDTKNKQKHKYRLEIEYSKYSSVVLESNMNIYISLKSEQIKPIEREGT